MWYKDFHPGDPKCPEVNIGFFYNVAHYASMCSILVMNVMRHLSHDICHVMLVTKILIKAKLFFS